MRPETPGPGQESVWDYPRPPRLEPTSETVEVLLAGRVVASTTAALRVLETSHPPTYYLPASCFEEGVLRPSPDARRSLCEWKGVATYLDLVADGTVAARAAWTYPEPTPTFAALRDHVAVYPGRVEACRVEGETVVPQPGGFYGGWVTSRVVGPFKGDPGTLHW